MSQDYLKANRALWDQLTGVHVKSKFYDLEGFVKEQASLSQIELGLLGRVQGKSVLHLQCHFGMDTLSLARRGATVTGVDFSAVAIEKAKELNKLLGLNATFLECDVNRLDEHLFEKFDIVFASFGVLGWHPNLDRWAFIASHFLKNNGMFCLAEFHPVLWMLSDDQSRIEHSYFKRDTIIVSNQKSYAELNGDALGTSYCWNHSFDELFDALKNAGLNIVDFKEYDYSPCNFFVNGVGTGEKYYIKGLEGIVPLAFSLTANKRQS